MSNSPILIIGCGYLGVRLARSYLAAGQVVHGLVRSAESGQGLSELGIQPLVHDLDAAEPPPGVANDARLFYFAPPPPSGVRDSRLTRFLEGLQGRPRRVLYISTTGVYGDCAGAWVDEERPLAPQADRAKRRADAERVLRDWGQRRGVETVVLRAAGIYGPGRLPLERLRMGLPLVREEEAPFTNRIHLDDLVKLCRLAMEKAPDGGLYNAADGHPSSMTDYFNRLADLAGLPRPPVLTLEAAASELSAGMMSYMRESRRLSNRKAVEELGMRFRYPSLAEGLPACLAEQGPEATAGDAPDGEGKPAQ